MNRKIHFIRKPIDLVFGFEIQKNGWLLPPQQDQLNYEVNGITEVTDRVDISVSLPTQSAAICL